MNPTELVQPPTQAPAVFTFETKSTDMAARPGIAMTKSPVMGANPATVFEAVVPTTKARSNSQVEVRKPPGNRLRTNKNVDEVSLMNAHLKSELEVKRERSALSVDLEHDQAAHNAGGLRKTSIIAEKLPPLSTHSGKLGIALLFSSNSDTSVRKMLRVMRRIAPHPCALIYHLNI
jgi:hypothetical protein